MFVAATGAYKSDPDFFTFPIYLLTKDLTKNFEKKIGLPPILAPQKRSLKKMTPPWLPMTPIFITSSVSPKQMWLFENNQSSKSLFSTVLLQF